MPLTPGTRLGPYEIVAALGAGGMGEVYRARDQRLGRDVAIKVLPHHLSSSAEVRARFEREAKTVSSLNHPNICMLFDVGRAPGEAGSGEIDYLVMELVEGETLAARLARGPLPAAEMLRIGIQIADALDRAHRAGVVHRDLKPGNVMLTRSGAKLMDFGLARATGLAGSAGGSGASMTALTQSPTVAAPLTAEGTIVGTFQYMAPEQLEGKEADARSDLWALGCVLYEMATGDRPFGGASQASLISSIMKDEPPSIATRAPLAPPNVDRVVQVCLAKDPEERIQTAHDVKLQLQWIAGEGSGTSAPVPVPVAAPRRANRERLAWGVAAVCLLLAAGAVVWGMSLRRPADRIIRMAVLPPENAVIDGELLHTAVSPDGGSIAFMATDTSGVSQLWVRDLEEPDARPLPGTENAILPFWSPDSRYIAFFADGKLKKIDAAGRNAQILCDAPDGRGGAWNRRGEILFAPTSEGPLFLVSEGGGRTSRVTTLDSTRAEYAHRFPSFLPDGRHFLYVSCPDGDTVQTRLATLGASETRPILTSEEGGAVYATPGHLIFGRNGALMAQRFDVRSGQLKGDPVVLGTDLTGASNYNGSPAASVSGNGVVVQRVRRARLSRLAWLDRDGRRIGTVPVAPGRYDGARLGPRDDLLATTRPSLGTGSDVWVVDLTRGLTTRLTVDRMWCEAPIWTPDGRWITFATMVEGERRMQRVLASGGGIVEDMTRLPGQFDNPSEWSPDGRVLLVRSLGGSTGEDVWMVPGGRDTAWTPLLNGRYHEGNPSISPDGRWIAYRSDESGRPELYVQAFPDGRARYRVSREGAGKQVRGSFGRSFWRRDGRELIFVSGDGATVMAAPIETAGGFHAGTPRPLFRLPLECSNMEVTSDGQRFLVVMDESSKEAAAIQVTLNWPAAIGKR